MPPYSRGPLCQPAVPNDVQISLAMGKGVDQSTWSKKDRETFDVLIEEMKQMTGGRQRATVMRIAPSMTPDQRKMTNADLGWNEQNYTFGFDSPYFRNNGTVSCLLNESQIICSHEVCARANTDPGIFCIEHETIQYYSYRIHAAKGHRMKDALRKQRDQQLAKDKEDWDNWKLRVSSKMEGLSRDAYRALSGFLAHDETSFELLWSTEAPKNSVISVGRTLSKLLSATIPLVRREFGDYVTERIKICPRGTSDLWWNPVFCLTYFGPVDISHIDAAVTNVCEVLNFNATLSYEVDYCLRAFLKQFKNLLKYVPRHRKTSRGVSVTRILCDIMESIRIPRNMSKQAPSLAGEEIFDVLSECALLSKNFGSDITNIANGYVEASKYPEDRLEEIKDKVVQRSPLPSVTELSVNNLLYQCKLACIWRVVHQKLHNGVPKTQLIREMVQQIQILAKERLSEIESVFHRLDAALARGHEHSSVSATDQTKLRALLFDAEAVWITEAEKYQEGVDTKRAQAAAEAARELERNPSLCSSSIGHRTPGMTLENCKQYALAYLEAFIRYRYTLESPTSKHMCFAIIQKNMWRGITEVFLAYLHFHPLSGMFTLHEDLTTLLAEVFHSDEIFFAKKGLNLARYFVSRHQQGWCAPAALLQLLGYLCHLSALNPASNKKVLCQLDCISQESAQALPAAWREPVKSISLAINQFYGFLVVECTSAFGRYDVEQVVMTTLWLMMAHVLVAKTKGQAESAFDYVMQFLVTVVGIDKKHISLVKKHFLVIAEDAKLRCPDLKRCAIHLGSKEDEVKSMKVDGFEAQDSEHYLTPAARTMPPSDFVVEYRAPRKLTRFFRSPDLEVKRIVGGKIGILDAAMALKYVAHRLKLLDNGKPDQKALRVLSTVFQKAERIVNMTPFPSTTSKISSTIIGMHNQCNIWELSESEEKVCCFFEAYMGGQRDQRDLACLIKSMHVWAVTGFDVCEPNNFDRLVRKLTELAGDFYPMDDIDLEQRLEVEAENHACRINKDLSLALRCRVSKLDYILSQHPKHEKPTTAFFKELLDDDDKGPFYDYCQHLAEEVDIRVNRDASEDVSVALGAIDHLIAKGLAIESNSEPLKLLARHAVDSWEDNDHENVVYFDWDHEESCGKGNRHESESEEEEEESIDGDSDGSQESELYHKDCWHDEHSGKSGVEIGSSAQDTRLDHAAKVSDFTVLDLPTQSESGGEAIDHLEPGVIAQTSEPSGTVSHDNSNAAIAPLRLSCAQFLPDRSRARSASPGRGNPVKSATSTPPSLSESTGTPTVRNTSRRILKDKSIKARSQSCAASKATMLSDESQRDQEAQQFSFARLHQLLADLEYGARVMNIDLRQSSVRSATVFNQDGQTVSRAATIHGAGSPTEEYQPAEVENTMPTTSSPETLSSDIQHQGSDAKQDRPDNLSLNFALDNHAADSVSAPASPSQNGLCSLFDEYETATCRSFSNSASDGRKSLQATDHIETRTRLNPSMAQQSLTARRSDSTDASRSKSVSSDAYSDHDETLRSPDFVLASENPDFEETQLLDDRSIETKVTPTNTPNLVETQTVAHEAIPEELSSELSRSSDDDDDDDTLFEPADSSTGSELHGKISAMISTLQKNKEMLSELKAWTLAVLEDKASVPKVEESATTGVTNSSELQKELATSDGNEPPLKEDEQTARIEACMENLEKMRSQLILASKSSESRESEQEEQEEQIDIDIDISEKPCIG